MLKLLSKASLPALSANEENQKTDGTWLLSQRLASPVHYPKSTVIIWKSFFPEHVFYICLLAGLARDRGHSLNAFACSQSANPERRASTLLLFFGMDAPMCAAKESSSARVQVEFISLRCGAFVAPVSAHSDTYIEIRLDLSPRWIYAYKLLAWWDRNIGTVRHHNVTSLQVVQTFVGFYFFYGIVDQVIELVNCILRFSCAC